VEKKRYDKNSSSNFTACPVEVASEEDNGQMAEVCSHTSDTISILIRVLRLSRRWYFKSRSSWLWLCVVLW